MIYIFGDSMAQGIYLDEDGNYRISRKSCIRRLKWSGLDIRSYAVHGYTTRKGLSTFESTETEPGSLCVIEFSGNDCDLDWDAVAREPEVFHEGQVPLAEFRENLRTFIRRARERQLEPLLITPPPLLSERYYRWVSRNRDGKHILEYLQDVEAISRWQERYVTAIRQVAAECGCRIADVRSWLLDQWGYQALMCEDGIHLNEAGQEFMAQRFAEVCRIPLRDRMMPQPA